MSEATPRLYVDFNELLAPDLVLLSQHDTKVDANGDVIQLYEGLAVSIFDHDVGADGKPDKLVVTGIVERNRSEGWAKQVKWCCRISPEGIRHESDMGSGVKYIRVKWCHDHADEPIWLYSELDGNRWEIRKVHVYADGHAEWTDRNHATDSTGLSVEPLPSLAEINAHPEFEAIEIAHEEFERAWASAQNLD